MQYKDEKKWFARLPIAHRGLHDDRVPENTLAACENAIKNGYAIEIDVRVSSDDEVVVFHDATVSRLTQQNGKVEEMQAHELQRLTVGTSQEHIPLLQEVTALVNNRVPIFIDLKSTFFDARRDVLALARALRNYDGVYSVMSFDPRVVAWWTGERALVERVNGKKIRHRNLGNGIAGHIFHGGNVFKVYSCIVAWKLYGSPGHFLAVPLDAVHRRFFQKRRSIRGNLPATPLLTWTVKDDVQQKRAQKYADASIFDYDPRLKFSIK